MSETRLLIDLGNTRVKWVYGHDGVLDEESAGRGDVDTLERALGTEMATAPATVLISSVASPEKTGRVLQWCARRWGVEVRELKSRAEQGGVRNAYSDPARLGVDRWLAIVGAAAHHGRPVVIWDLGTATTLDAVDAVGRHLGGWILPGPETMLGALARNTQLPVPPDLAGAGRLEPGQATAECIQRGVVAAQAGALNQFLKHVSETIGTKPKLVVAGGAAGPVLSAVDIEHVEDPWLVFRGMLVE